MTGQFSLRDNDGGLVFPPSLLRAPLCVLFPPYHFFPLVLSLSPPFLLLCHFSPPVLVLSLPPGYGPADRDILPPFLFFPPFPPFRVFFPFAAIRLSLSSPSFLLLLPFFCHFLLSPLSSLLLLPLLLDHAGAL